jgi:hypothetical protein
MPTPDESIAICDRILNGSRDREEVAQLRQWLKVSGTTLQRVSQDGKFSTNIGQVQGGEIQIGEANPIWIYRSLGGWCGLNVFSCIKNNNFQLIFIRNIKYPVSSSYLVFPYPFIPEMLNDSKKTKKTTSILIKWRRSKIKNMLAQ